MTILTYGNYCVKPCRKLAGTSAGKRLTAAMGLKKARELRPDLIVLDVSMPVMNGLEAARELTRLLPQIPLLMFTSHETPHLKQEALSAGVAALVSKSSVAALVSSIQALLKLV